MVDDQDASMGAHAPRKFGTPDRPNNNRTLFKVAGVREEIFPSHGFESRVSQKQIRKGKHTRQWNKEQKRQWKRNSDSVGNTLIQRP